MKYDRHQFRAKWHDYNGGIYFVTICSHQKRHIFGSIVGTRFIASALGEIITEHIQALPSYYDDVEIWNHVVMPNHIHIVIAVGTRFIASATTQFNESATTEFIASATTQFIASATPRFIASATTQFIASATPRFIASATPQFIASATPQFIASATTEFIASATPRFIASATTEFIASATTEFIESATTQFIESATTQFIESATTQGKENLGCLKPSRNGERVEDYHHNSRLATIIGAFKAGVTRTARTRKIASVPCWQSRFHEHIIRNQRAFDNIMNYIDTNIVNWNKDCFHE